jgi:hypothetical protein
MQLKSIAAIIVLLLVVASLLVAGCTSSSNTSSTTGATDYSDQYNKLVSNEAIITPFHRITSAHGNDLYVGVVGANRTQNITNRSYEHAKSKDDAAQIFNETVAAYKSNGYVTKSVRSALGPTGGQTWTGTKGVKQALVVYWYNDNVMGSNQKSWIVENSEPA